jgi:hypothetical protein
MIFLSAFSFAGHAQQSELNLVAGDGTVTIEWSGLDVTSIKVDGVYDKTLNNPVSPCVITGLENGRLYRFILNQPDANAGADNPLVGMWVGVRAEGYEIYNGERFSWADDFSPWTAEALLKMTFLPDGTMYNYNDLGLPDPEYTMWRLEDDELTLFEDDEGEKYTVVSLTSSELIVEFHEIEEISDVDLNGDGVINALDYNYYESYQKTTLRKAPLSVSAFAIPGEPFAPQNVQVTPLDDDGTARVSWTLPPTNDSYETAEVSYMFTVNGELSESIYDIQRRDDESTATVYLPDEPCQFRLIAVRYIWLEDGTNTIPVIGKSAPVTVGNEDVATATNIYASEGYLHIHTSGDGLLKVYTPGGQLYRQQRISAGRTSIPLARGLYIVTFGKRTAKVMVSG